MAMDHGHGHDTNLELQTRHDELEIKIRTWKRTSQNDPFWAASKSLAARLSAKTGNEVIVGFNEFCGPSVEEALDEAVSNGAIDVIVITPMMTPGGEHSEEDIPDAIDDAKEKHPHVRFRYAWPFEESAVASFLAKQLSNH
jgi:sirohydrochlorin cobaltochelatase